MLIQALIEFMLLPGMERFLRNYQKKSQATFMHYAILYLKLYLPACGFCVEVTDRYFSKSGRNEACVISRKHYNPGEEIQYLEAWTARINADEFAKFKGPDFSVITHQDGSGSMLLGPARFVNHSCQANSTFKRRGKRISLVVIKPIAPGQEITVYYGKKYFGKYNQECLCLACEIRGVNGFGSPLVTSSSESSGNEDSEEDDDENENDNINDNNRNNEAITSPNLDIPQKRKLNKRADGKPSNSNITSRSANIPSLSIGYSTSEETSNFPSRSSPRTLDSNSPSSRVSPGEQNTPISSDSLIKSSLNSVTTELLYDSRAASTDSVPDSLASGSTRHHRLRSKDDVNKKVLNFVTFTFPDDDKHFSATQIEYRCAKALTSELTLMDYICDKLGRYGMWSELQKFYYSSPITASHFLTLDCINCNVPFFGPNDAIAPRILPNRFCPRCDQTAELFNAYWPSREPQDEKIELKRPWDFTYMQKIGCRGDYDEFMKEKAESEANKTLQSGVKTCVHIGKCDEHNCHKNAMKNDAIAASTKKSDIRAAKVSNTKTTGNATENLSRHFKASKLSRSCTDVGSCNGRDCHQSMLKKALKRASAPKLKTDKIASRLRDSSRKILLKNTSIARQSYKKIRKDIPCTHTGQCNGRNCLYNALGSKISALASTEKSVTTANSEAAIKSETETKAKTAATKRTRKRVKKPQLGVACMHRGHCNGVNCHASLLKHAATTAGIANTPATTAVSDGADEADNSGHFNKSSVSSESDNTPAYSIPNVVYSNIEPLKRKRTRSSYNTTTTATASLTPEADRLRKHVRIKFKMSLRSSSKVSDNAASGEDSINNKRRRRDSASKTKYKAETTTTTEIASQLETAASTPRVRRLILRSSSSSLKDPKQQQESTSAVESMDSTRSRGIRTRSGTSSFLAQDIFYTGVQHNRRLSSREVIGQTAEPHRLNLKPKSKRKKETEQESDKKEEQRGKVENRENEGNSKLDEEPVATPGSKSYVSIPKTTVDMRSDARERLKTSKTRESNELEENSDSANQKYKYSLSPKERTTRILRSSSIVNNNINTGSNSSQSSKHTETNIPSSVTHADADTDPANLHLSERTKRLLLRLQQSSNGTPNAPLPSPDGFSSLSPPLSSTQVTTASNSSSSLSSISSRRSKLTEISNDSTLHNTSALGKSKPAYDIKIKEESSEFTTNMNENAAEKRNLLRIKNTQCDTQSLPEPKAELDDEFDDCYINSRRQRRIRKLVDCSTGSSGCDTDTSDCESLAAEPSPNTSSNYHPFLGSSSSPRKARMCKLTFTKPLPNNFHTLVDRESTHSVLECKNRMTTVNQSLQDVEEDVKQYYPNHGKAAEMLGPLNLVMTGKQSQHGNTHIDDADHTADEKENTVTDSFYIKAEDGNSSSQSKNLNSNATKPVSQSSQSPQNSSPNSSVPTSFSTATRGPRIKKFVLTNQQPQKSAPSWRLMQKVN